MAISKQKNIQKQYPFNLVLIGSSAGGLEALQIFFKNMPIIDNCVFIVAQHISPEHTSLLPNLLAKTTTYKVLEAKHQATLQSGFVYITPPDNQITIEKNKFKLNHTLKLMGAKPNVDYLFNSIDVAAYKNVFAIVMSGTGSDGALGSKHISQQKGFVLVQQPQSAKFDGMPNAAIATKCASFIVEPTEMGIVIEKITLGETNKISNDLKPNNAFDKFLYALQNFVGADFSQYNHDVVKNVLEMRLKQLKLVNVDDYLHYLKEEQSEINNIYEQIFEPTSLFICDKEAHKAVKNSLSELVAQKANNDEFRIWIPGCGTGEMAYQIAILLNDILEQKNKKLNVKVFATDIYDDAISKARAGVFKLDDLKCFDKKTIDKYFTSSDVVYKISKQLRLMVLFSKHDLVGNPPFLKIDFICCNEVLTYFNSKLQQRVFNFLHYSMQPNGILFLGNSESAIQSFGLFNIKNGNVHLYAKNNNVFTQPQQLKSRYKSVVHNTSESNTTKKPIFDLEDAIKDALFSTYDYPFVVVNKNLDIVESHGKVGLFLNFSNGTIHLNLLKMLQSDMLIEARAVLNKSFKDNLPHAGKIRKYVNNDKLIAVRLKVKPVNENIGANVLFLLIFEYFEINEEFNNLLDAAHIKPDKNNLVINELQQELDATKAHLQNYIEELETGNEELQTLNEELQSSNEELQASTEELEASNEALQSANEEVRVAFDELSELNAALSKFDDELKSAYASLEALINSNENAIVMVDKHFKLLYFNNKANEFNTLFNRKPLTKGVFYLDFVSNENIAIVKTLIDDAIKGENSEVEITETSSLGVNKVYAVYASPVYIKENEVFAVSINYKDITAAAIKKSVENITKDRIHNMFSSSADIIFTLDKQQRHTSLYGAQFELNESLKSYFLGKNAIELLGPENAKIHIDANNKALKGESLTYEWTNEENGALKYFQTSVSPLYDSNKNIVGIMGVGRDVTQFKKSQIEVNHSNQRYLALFKNNLMPIALCQGAELKIIDYNDAFLTLVNSPSEKVDGCNFNDLLAFDNYNAVCNEILRLNQGDKPLVFDKVKAIVSGKNLCLQISAFAINNSSSNVFVITLHDVTEINKLLAQIESSAITYKNITNNISDLVWTTDIDFKCNFVSPSVQNIFGYSPDEFLKVPIVDLFNKKSVLKLKSFYQNMQALIDAGKASEKDLFKLELEGIRKDGKNIILLNNLRFLFSAGGSLEGVIGITRNITQEKAYEADIAKFKNIADQSVVGNLITDFNGKVLYVNKSLASMHGYTINELYGKNISLFFNMQQMKSLADLLANLKTRGTVEAKEMQHVTKEGKFIQTLVSGQTIYNDAGVAKFFTFNISDITKLKQIEYNMHKVNERYQYASKAVSDAVWDLDLLANTLELSENFTTQFGSISFTDLKTQINEVLKHLHPNELDALLDDFKKTLAGKANNWNAEHLFLTSGGQYANVVNRAYVLRDLNGKAIRVIGAIQDVTRQKQEALNLQIYEKTIRNIKDAILITEPLDKNGNLFTSFANDAFTELTGYSFEEIYGNSPVILNGIDTDEQELSKIYDAVSNNLPVNVILLNYKKNGETFWNDISISPVFDENKTLVKWVAIYRDVTEKIIKQKQNELLNHLRIIFSNSNKATKDLLDEAVYYLIEQIGFEFGEVWQVDTNNENINLVSKKAINEDVYNSFYLTKDYSYRFFKGQGVPGLVWQNQKMLVIENVIDNKLFLRQLAAKNAGINTVFGIPLTYGNHVKGVLLFGSTKPLANKNKYDYLFENVEEVLGSELERLIFKEDINRFFDVSSEIMCIAGFDGYYKKVNPFMCQLLGYTEQEILNKPIFEFVHNDDLELVNREFEKIVKEGQTSFNFTNRIITKEGKIVWLHWSTRVFANEGLTYSMARDITAQKHAEIMVKRSGKMAKVGAIEIFVPTQKLYISDIGLEILELPNTMELSVTSLVDLIFPDYQKAALDLLNKTINNGTVETLEAPVTTYLGKTKWFKVLSEPELLDNECQSVFISFQDITEIKQAQLKLLNTLNELTVSNDRFLKVTQATNDAIWDWDLINNTVFKSSGYIKLFGEVEGEDLTTADGWKQRLHPDDVAQVEQSITNAVNNPINEVWKAQYRFKRSDNTYAYVEDRGFIIRDLNKKAIRIVGAMSDVSKLKEQFNAIKLQNDKLHEIAFSQSHVVRAPVSRIMGLNTLIQDPDTPIDEKLKCLEFIDKSCKELDTIILDIVLKTYDLDNIVKLDT